MAVCLGDNLSASLVLPTIDLVPILIFELLVSCPSRLLGRPDVVDESEALTSEALLRTSGALLRLSDTSGVAHKLLYPLSMELEPAYPMDSGSLLATYNIFKW